MRYQRASSEYLELTPGNGHVFIFLGDKVDLSNGKIVPAGGETVSAFFSASATSDDAIAGLSIGSLADVGVQNNKQVYVGALDGSALTTALTEELYPDGTEIFEIVKAGTRAREVTRMIVRRFRET